MATHRLTPSRLRHSLIFALIASGALSSACYGDPVPYDKNKASGGSGQVGNSGGAAGSGSTNQGSGGAPIGSGGIGTSSGGLMPVETVECLGGFPAEDTSASAHLVTASTESWGALPHFWTTFGLGRLGLYLPSESLAPEFQAQDKLNFDGQRWSAALREHTTDAIANLGLTSIRAHGLFHDDIGIYKEDTSGNAVYDFTRSDEIFDFLIENGVAPIVELASMPAALAEPDPNSELEPKGPFTVFDWKMIVSPPKDYDKWGALVQAFVAHSVERYGVDVVSKWYFEVWNEPECCTGKFWKGGAEGYMKLYDKAAAGVVAALPGGRVGGPVSSQPAELIGGQWAGGAGVQFLDHIKASGSPLGFFTFHTWSFIEGAVDGYFTGLDLLDSYQLNNIQIAVTEFGPTWEFGLRGEPLTTTTGDPQTGEPEWEPQEMDHGATFVAQVYSNIAQRCAKEGRRFPITYAWWTLSDVFDEGYSDAADYVLEENPFIGAMGLINRESIHKPAYNAYKFLAKMGDEQLALNVTGAGDVGGMAARDRSGGVQVLLYNGQDPGLGYQDDKYYTAAGEQEIGVNITGLDPEITYDVTAYRIDETHGNSFADWDALGRPTMASMQAADWQTLRDNMDSAPEVLGQAMCGESYSQKFNLSSPGVLLVTLTPAVAE